ncbi:MULTISPECIES: redox-sensing transcriptional repressor Rex [Petrotoga]|uniref:Redox-sensing transcriptional repressor Rex n=4 Tax=Petrotoga TaxID=28236 RepID=A0A4R8EUW3_9BACT|nr:MULTISPECIES: redox-sensing transcriptional repressor Rex [Petrotoga]PNR97950.1 REX family transcriptional regulator [Petrotoga olearia DSM 13574]POZ89107.1 redox-sensing transcriptional repressor rex [Petrotoga sibirica DSM 13575]RMA75521.1 redox-sensing transcriptional repressor [Petrotoga olearia]TDX14505.1 redox-sensing transcriptional repressor [Petrotoga sibirica]
MKSPKVPKPTIKRLAMYNRFLKELVEEGIPKTSSKEIAEALNIKASQVRKDLSYFGEFGKRGVGYDVEDLCLKIQKILGTERIWNVAIIGVGNLGRAISHYPELEKYKFKIVAAYDVDKRKINSNLLPGIPIKHIKELKNKNNDLDFEIAILTVPSNVAQEVTNILIEAGVKGILNFAPVTLNSDDHVVIENVDFVISLKTLTYEIVSQNL